jgi:hypothetical protein
VLPHPHIHRRRDQHGLVGGQQQRRSQIVGMAGGHLRHQIGGGGRDDHQIGGAAEFDVTHLGLVGQIEQIAIDLAPGQGRDR